MVIVTIAITAAQGHQVREASPFGEDKASMLVVLDNSESMLECRDLPSRLERSKQKIRDLLAARKGGNTGLVVYARRNTSRCRLPDSKAELFLAAITPEIMPVDGKAAEKALLWFSNNCLVKSRLNCVAGFDGVNPTTIKAEKFFNENSYQPLIWPQVIAKL
ncbi:VWA domain-containing protein [Vibrio chagasii]|nr:VWA domain-containing protein [Vibrio chagasii]